jgi:hypothetical protein
MKTRLRLLAGISAIGIALVGAVSTAYAGPYILAGTDADEHGSFSAGVNQDGWFFMQRALENLAPGVTNGNKQVVIMGSAVGGAAQIAALSAFNNSNLPGLGWTAITLNDGALTTFLTGGLAGAGIVMMDSAANVGGGASAAELAAFTANAALINNFLGAGGGLFSQANGYGWVSALVPGLGVTGFQTTGLTLTPAGNTAFPGLNNGDLSAGPWHNFFTNTGAIPILATGPNGQAVVIGSGGGTVTDPEPPPTSAVPDGGSFFAVYLALGGLAFAFRRHSFKRAA